MNRVSVTKQYRTETAHRLRGYDGGCRFLHGHSYLWEVTASAEVGDDGLSVDFKTLKAAMVAVLEPLDHAVVLHEDDVFARAIIEDAEDLGAHGRRVHLWPVNPTAENMALWAGRKIQGLLKDFPKAPRIKSVRVWETASSFAEATGPFN